MGNFKQLLEKATSSSESEPDWEAILDIIEEIKTKNVAVKAAVKDIRKRLLETDATVVYHTLQVLDSVMKNCSSDVHSEVLSAEFMLVMKGVVTSSRDGKSGKAIDKALELIGEWKVAFGQQAGYKAVYDTFSELEKEGYHIPEAEVASASFVKKAPEWVLGDRCYMCRSEFNRFKGTFRHHCRNCGKSVCAQCSSKRTALAHFGIDQPTRVCDLCFKNVDHPVSKGDGDEASGSSDLPAEYLKSSLAQESQKPAPSSHDSELKMQEEDDLQIAIAMSLNEQDNKKPATASSAPPPPVTTAPSAPPPAPPASTLYSTIVHQDTRSTAASQPARPQDDDTETDPNLARYLDRNYWEQRKEQQDAPASDVGPQPVVVTTTPAVQTVAVTTAGSTLAESVSKTVGQFLARLQAVSSAGGSVATDPVVLAMFQNLTALHPQLLKQIDEVQLKKAHQEHTLQKLQEAKQARVTLNKMRRQHAERVRQQEQEQSMLARMQMEQKLALLRQQKQEQLAYQQSLQADRLESLQLQRSDYERNLQRQREAERQQLIAQEQQIIQQQLGVRPQSKPEPLAAAPQPLYLHDPTQAQPLPAKLPYAPNMDPPPPPYQPQSLMNLPAQQQQQPATLTEASMQPLSLQDPSLSYQPQPYSLQQPQPPAPQAVLPQQGNAAMAPPIAQHAPPPASSSQQLNPLQMQPHQAGPMQQGYQQQYNSMQPQQQPASMQTFPQQQQQPGMQTLPQQQNLPQQQPGIQNLPQQQPGIQTMPQQQQAFQQQPGMQTVPQILPQTLPPQQQPGIQQQQQPPPFPQPSMAPVLPQQFQPPPAGIMYGGQPVQQQPPPDLMGGEVGGYAPSMQPFRPASEPPLISFD